MPDPDATSRFDRARGGETVEEPLAPVRQPQRLIPYLEAAALSFLGVLALGAVLLLVVKLQFPGLGAGADPVEILTSVVILSLAVLRAQIHVGELTFSVAPLGALFVAALIVRWACRSTVASVSRRVLWVGPLFGATASFAAVTFRHRFEPDPVYAGALSTAFFATVWALLFATWFSVTRAEGSAAVLRRAMRDLERKRRFWWEAVVASGLMLGVTAILSTAGALVWLILVLLGGGGPQALSAADLVAAFVYVAAFAPNLVIAAAALSLGAPLQIGAGLTVRGRVRNRLQELSISPSEGLDFTVLLVAVPLIACGLTGFWVGRNSQRAARPLPLLAASAALFAIALSFLSWLGRARLGAQLAADRGFGVVAPEASAVFVLALVWAFTGSLLGWTIARVNK